VRALYLHVADDGGVLSVDGENGRSAWLTAAALASQLDTLRSRGGSVIVSSEKGSPLAAEIMHIIHEAGVPVVASPDVHTDATRTGGSTTLMSFAYVGAADLAEDLIRRGAPLEAEDEEGFTALMYAANAGQEKIVELLIRAGADVNHRDSAGSVPLMFAAQHGHVDIVRKMLAAGADAGAARRSDGLTAYDFAARSGNARLASLILVAGAQQP
jgi:uncharacterized protein